MTEPELRDLFTAIDAHLLDFVAKSGRLGELATCVSTGTITREALAEELRQLSMDLASGLERLTELADAADTALNLAIIAGPPTDSWS